MTETLAMAMPTAASRGIDFEALYRSSRDDVYAYVMTLVRDRSTAEDVTAAAFERAYRRRATFNARRGNPRGWLFGIARNAALDELRRRKRVTPSDTEPVDPDNEGAAEQELELSLRRQTVRAAMAELEPRDRELVALKFFAGLSNGELARVLGISETNAATKLHRTVEKLRKSVHVTS